MAGDTLRRESGRKNTDELGISQFFNLKDSFVERSKEAPIPEFGRPTIAPILERPGSANVMHGLIHKGGIEQGTLKSSSKQGDSAAAYPEKQSHHN
mmetsp:Transcript_20812/g.32113  ORF Transcript_20812/g.32113 Transcript_20812/m.32113 type:complete len:96 (-) Transcript_20812:1078-1365(-)